MNPSVVQSYPQLQRQVKMAQYMMLGTVVITVVNLALLLGNASFYVPYYAAVAYYFVWFGKLFDNNFITGGSEIGEFTNTGLLLCFIVLAVLLVLWWLGRGHTKWLKVSMGVLAVDALAELILAILVFGDPLNCLMEVIIHIAVIWEVQVGVKAQKELDRLDAQPAPEAQTV